MNFLDWKILFLSLIVVLSLVDESASSKIQLSAEVPHTYETTQTGFAREQVVAIPYQGQRKGKGLAASFGTPAGIRGSYVIVEKEKDASDPYDLTTVVLNEEVNFFGTFLTDYSPESRRRLQNGQATNGAGTETGSPITIVFYKGTAEVQRFTYTELINLLQSDPKYKTHPGKEPTPNSVDYYAYFNFLCPDSDCIFDKVETKILGNRDSYFQGHKFGILAKPTSPSSKDTNQSVTQSGPAEDSTTTTTTSTSSTSTTDAGMSTAAVLGIVTGVVSLVAGLSGVARYVFKSVKGPKEGAQVTNYVVTRGQLPPGVVATQLNVPENVPGKDTV